MHVRTIIRLRQKFALLLAGACAACIGVPAQAGIGASTKPASQQVIPAPQASPLLASIVENDDCYDDYAAPAQPYRAGYGAGYLVMSPVYASLADQRAPAVITAAPPPPPVWDIAMADKTINGAFGRWATQAGWQLRWELPVDYAVEADTSIPGTFEEAVEIVARSMEGAEIPMKAIFYKGNKVLRMVPRGNQ